MQNNNNKKNGYTIIETMIAVSLFLIVITIGTGSLLNSTLLQKKSQDMRSIMDNLSFIMEDISKNLRTGSNYSGGDTQISFLASDGNPWVYAISNGNIQKSVDGGTNWIELNSSEINLESGSGFSIIGISPSDNLQPFVTIRLVGKITAENNLITPFSLQTSVSQRLVDI
jgi:prepilin-type N-terminal cleavage/methylation domain-containing protein